MKNSIKNKLNKKFAISLIEKLIITAFIIAVFMLTFGETFATDDPLTVINNLSDFIFGVVKAIGMILLGFGIVQVGMSLKSHDPSQRANGFMTLARRNSNNFCKRNFNINNRIKYGGYFIFAFFGIFKRQKMIKNTEVRDDWQIG